MLHDTGFQHISDVHADVYGTRQRERRIATSHPDNAMKRLMLYETALMLIEADTNMHGSSEALTAR